MVIKRETDPFEDYGTMMALARVNRQDPNQAARRGRHTLHIVAITNERTGTGARFLEPCARAMLLDCIPHRKMPPGLLELEHDCRHSTCREQGGWGGVGALFQRFPNVYQSPPQTGPCKLVDISIVTEG